MMIIVPMASGIARNQWPHAVNSILKCGWLALPQRWPFLLQRPPNEWMASNRQQSAVAFCNSLLRFAIWPPSRRWPDLIYNDDLTSFIGDLSSSTQFNSFRWNTIVSMPPRLLYVPRRPMAHIIYTNSMKSIQISLNHRQVDGLTSPADLHWKVIPIENTHAHTYTHNMLCYRIATATNNGQSMFKVDHENQQRGEGKWWKSIGRIKEILIIIIGASIITATTIIMATVVIIAAIIAVLSMRLWFCGNATNVGVRTASHTASNI